VFTRLVFVQKIGLEYLVVEILNNEIIYKHYGKIGNYKKTPLKCAKIVQMDPGVLKILAVNTAAVKVLHEVRHITTIF